MDAIFKSAKDIGEDGVEVFAYRSKKARRGHPNVFERKELMEELFAFLKEGFLIQKKDQSLK